MFRTILPTALLFATAGHAQLPQFRSAPERVFPNTDGYQVAVGDLDGDGFADLVSVWRDHATLSLNDGTGRFSSTTLTDPSPGIWRSAVLGDIDADGDPDLLVGRLFGQPLLFTNDGAGRLTAIPFSTTASFVAQSVALVDVDGDGDLDAIVSGSPVEVHRNDGGGVFTEDPAVIPGGGAHHFVVGDVESDGDPDLVTIPLQSGSSLLVNDGTGRFATAPARLSRVDGVRSVAIADVDDDGRLDLFFGRGSGPARLFVQRPDLGFDDVTSTHLPAPPGAIPEYAAAFADVDVDGDLDLFLGRHDAVRPATDRLLLNRGDGSFAESPPQRLTARPTWTSDARFADLDGDGDPDLVVGTYQPTTQVRLQLNHHVQVSAQAPPTRGLDFEVRIDSQPGYASGFAVAVLVLGIRGAPAVLSPFGTWWLRPSPSIEIPPVYLPPSVGSALWVLPVPPTSTLAGVEIGVQGAMVHPAMPAQLTNAWFDVVR